MWTYEKKLQYPVNIKQTNSKLAKAIITQYGGADCIRYNNFLIPDKIKDFGFLLKIILNKIMLYF